MGTHSNNIMAGAGQPWYMPLTWPLGHIGTAVTKPEEDPDVPKPSATPYLTLVGHLTSMAAATRSWALAYLCIFHLPQQFGQVYPAFGPAKDFSMDWMLLIVGRNLIATWIICGFWDWFLYFSPLQAKLAKYKMNPQYPSFNQIKHDALVTTSMLCIVPCTHGRPPLFLTLESSFTDRFTPCTTSRTTRQHSPGRTCTQLRRHSTTRPPLFLLPSDFTLCTHWR